MTRTAIDMADVSKRFGAAQSLDRLTLRVEAGAIFGFLGPNGAGKTTTLRTLLGLVRADAGTVRVLGLDPSAQPTEVRRQVGVLLENDGVYERMTALANLDYYARIHHVPAPERAPRIESLLRSFDLWERRSEAVVRWSKGMRQKLAIARALVHKPKLLLLDEPFSGLDPAAAAELRERIVRLGLDEQVTVLLTTHDLAHVEKICSAVAVVQLGHVIASGAPGQLGGSKTDPPGSAAIEVDVSGDGLDSTVLTVLQEARLITSFEWVGGAGATSAVVRCDAEQRRALASELMRHGVTLYEVHTRTASLEDAFLSLIGGVGVGERGNGGGVA